MINSGGQTTSHGRESPFAPAPQEKNVKDFSLEGEA